MGFIIKLISMILKSFNNIINMALPDEMKGNKEDSGILNKLKRPFINFAQNNDEDDENNKIAAKLRKKIKKIILSAFKKVLKVISTIITTFGEVILILLILILLVLILVSILGMFGAFNGTISVDFERLQDFNQDEQIYRDSQNTNEIRKSFYQYVSDTSYYQMFNLRDMNQDTINPFLKYLSNEFSNSDNPEDLFAYNKFISNSGGYSFDQRYIYTDANKNHLKHLKSAKITSLSRESYDFSKTDEFFRDYYNREKNFMLSESLLSEMNRLLFGEYSGGESIVYPESFVKPVAFVNDFYRIQTDYDSNEFGNPYVYLTKRVSKEQIDDTSSEYFGKEWLEGIIYSKPSKIVYDYAVTSKNTYYWSDTDNNTSKRINFGNISNYASFVEDLEYEDGSKDSVENLLKLYWIVKDSDEGYNKINSENGNVQVNPYNEHMTASLNDDSYSDYFDGPYTKIIVENGEVKVDLSSKIENGRFKYVDIEGNHVDELNGIKIQQNLNKFPNRHLQLVPINDESGKVQLNSRYLFNSIYVEQKSVKESFRHFPEYYSGFSEFVEIDLNRLPPKVGAEKWVDDEEISMGLVDTTCDEDDYIEDSLVSFSKRKCSIIRRYTGSRGLAWVNAKLTEFGNWVNNSLTGQNNEAEIGVSAEAMFYLLLNYEDYLIETGEYGVAWDYKYYTNSERDLELTKENFKDNLGLNEVFVDSWDDTRVYKETMDAVKLLDENRTIKTQYVPTGILSGTEPREIEGNINFNSISYGWRIKNDTGNPETTTFERVAGEASLEYPEPVDFNMKDFISNFSYDSPLYGDNNFRYRWENGEILDKGKAEVEAYFNSLTEEEKAALTNFEEPKDYRNQEYVWNPESLVYRPTVTGIDGIIQNIETGITSSNDGKVTERVGPEYNLPLEVKSVRDYGLGSVLSYLEGVRVVYNAGVFMDEVYSEEQLENAFESLGISGFDDFKRGYYPKDLLDKYPEIIDSMKVTPMPIENLQPFAETVLSLQYAATDDEISNTNSRNELIELISKRNIDGIQVSSLNTNMNGFTISENGENLGVNLCVNCSSVCSNEETEGERNSCIRTCQLEGGYFNTQLESCSARCDNEFETNLIELESLDLEGDSYTERKNEINQDKLNCQNKCESDFPDRSINCDETEIDKSGIGSIYAYSPYLKPGYLDFIFSNNRNEVQFLDPLQYYIEWFDHFEDIDRNSKELSLISGEGLVSQLDTRAAQALRLAKNDNNLGFSNANHFKFLDAGRAIRGEYKQEFYDNYLSDTYVFDLINPIETYRVYMIEEAVTFLGTFTYTYKDDIVNIGNNPIRKQINSLVYADRYYYLSNYIFSVPFNNYISNEVYSYTGNKLSYKESCPSNSEAWQIARSKISARNLFNPGTWFDGDPDIYDVSLDCFHETFPNTCTYPIIGTDGSVSVGSYSCPEYQMKYSVVASYAESVELKNIDTIDEIKVLEENLENNTREKIMIGMKIYDKLSGSSWLDSDENSSNISSRIFHNYDLNYRADEVFYGDDDNHYKKFNDVNDSISGRTGYSVISDVYSLDSLNLPDDLNFDIDLESGKKSPNTLNENDIINIKNAADNIYNLKPQVINVTNSFGRSVTGYVGQGITLDHENIGVGLFGSNRDGYGYPIPIFRHFAGTQREILPRQNGYYFNGETFESWQTRLVVTPVSTSGKINSINNERNILQSYIYNYISNFETYVPFDVKSDYDLMTRGRTVYHHNTTSETSTTSETISYSGEIYNMIKESPAWEETLEKLVFGRDGLLDISVAQIISGIIEVEIERASELMINQINSKIDDDELKVLNDSSNKSIILENLRTSGREKNLNVEIRKVGLKLKNGTVKYYELSQLGPGAIMYNYNLNGDGNISTMNISPGQLCESDGILSSGYSTCFNEVTLEISETLDERLNVNKSIDFVSTKFGKLLRKYGDVQKALLAYFHGEIYADELIRLYDLSYRGTEWISRDDEDMISEALANISGNYDLLSDSSSINFKLLSSDVVRKSMSYITSSSSRSILSEIVVNPSGSIGINVGTSNNLGRSAYEKWKPYIDEFSNKYEVDAALIAAYIQQESSSNSLAGICYDDNIPTSEMLGSRTCTKLYKNTSGEWLYNGGGGLGQIHNICDNSNNYTEYDSSHSQAQINTNGTLLSGICERSVVSKVSGDRITVSIAVPKEHINSISDVSNYLSIDSRFGDTKKSLEWSVAYMSNLLDDFRGDYFKALVAYNAGSGAVNRLVEECGNRGWYNCYQSQYSKDYVSDVMRYYDKDIATSEIKYSGNEVSRQNNFFGFFKFKSVGLLYNRDYENYKNSGVELFKPRSNASRDTVRNMLVNNANFGEMNYSPYDNYNLLSLFTARDIYNFEGSMGSGMGWIGMDANIYDLGERSTAVVPDEFKFAYISPLIPMNSPTGKDLSEERLTSHFGMRNLGGREMHEGLDFGLTSGTPLYSVAPGKVIVSSFNPNGYGYYIKIEHVLPENRIITNGSQTYEVDKIYTVYAHNSRLDVKVGDVISDDCSLITNGANCVNIRNPIALSGNTGRSTGPHLHFEIDLTIKDPITGEILPQSRNNRNVDPYYWLTTIWN